MTGQRAVQAPLVPAHPPVGPKLTGRLGEGDQPAQIGYPHIKCQSFAEVPFRADVEPLSLQEQAVDVDLAVLVVCTEFAGKGLPMQAAFQKTPAHLPPERGLSRPGAAPRKIEIDHSRPVRGNARRIEVPPAERSADGNPLAPVHSEAPLHQSSQQRTVQRGQLHPLAVSFEGPGETGRSPPLSRVGHRELAPVPLRGPLER